MAAKLSSQEIKKIIASRWQAPHNITGSSAAFGFTSQTPAALSDVMDGISAGQNEKRITSRWQSPHNAPESAVTLGITSETPAALSDAMGRNSAGPSIAYGGKLRQCMSCI